MRFGASRYGPRAPCTVQLGKYDVLTTTGVPIRSTWNEMESTVSCVCETRAGVIGTDATPWPPGPVVPILAASTRGHDAGPDSVNGWCNRLVSIHHGSVAHSQPLS